MSISTSTHAASDDCDTVSKNDTPCSDSTSMINTSKTKTDKLKIVTRIITLGDGDFTYSLDLARYLSQKQEQEQQSSSLIELVATGIDSRSELFSKYKDSGFILSQLEATKTVDSLSVTIQHQVNAIVSAKRSVPSTALGFDHVMFHHPHLGVENAELHGYFMSHFFHSATHHWMKPKGGLLHVTLVVGQFERWKCQEAAKRHGLNLLQRNVFVPPPVEHELPTYQYRRHQTGKSFGARRPTTTDGGGSETWVFGRIVDKDSYASLSLFNWKPVPLNKKGLPLDSSTTASLSNVEKDQSNSGPKVPMMQPSLSGSLPCPHCDKVFQEERSRKCHVRAKHPEGSDKKAKSAPSCWVCHHCINPETNRPPRIFGSAQSLQDHQRAKHSALHATIRPDWSTSDLEETKNTTTTTTTTSNEFGACSICTMPFQSRDQASTHNQDFIPLDRIGSFACSFCERVFPQNRARLQHENFCSKRPQ